MSKKFKGLRCPYCSKRIAVTGDHIFAREFFLPSARTNLPQAPICEECNNEKSKLEHYLTTVLPFGGRHADASENLASMVPKRLGKNAKLHRQLRDGQQVVFVPGDTGSAEQTTAIPFDGEKLEELISMIVRGLIWFHWRVYLEDSHTVRTHTVTAHGLQLCEETLFRPNARDRVRGNLGNGAFVYEGAQGVDDPAITAWKFIVYGGLASYEDVIAPENLGSHLVSMTGPSAAFLRAAVIANK